MERPNQNEYGTFYAYYISLVPEGDIIELMRAEHQKTQAILQQIPPQKGSFKYEEDKWTIKELLQHMIDSERIMNYRALRFARKDKTELPGFEQDDYVSVLEETERFPLSTFVEDWEILRENTVRLFSRFNEEESKRTGRANNNIFSVRALAYINVGHEIHHRNILLERYLKS